MPGMNGIDFCGHLMEERPGIKVLVMSRADVREIMRNAALPFLTKPFDGETLKTRVRKILAAPAQPDNNSENPEPPGMNPAAPDYLNAVAAPTAELPIHANGAERG